MKLQTLPTKRRPISNGVWRKLSAVTQGRRKQRVAAAGTLEEIEEEGGSNIGRALLIIVLIHVVAVILMLVHHHFLRDRAPAAQQAAPQAVAPAAATPPAAAPAAEPADNPQIRSQELSTGGAPYIVRAGDNYASIAKAHDVREADLRQVNANAEIRPGFIMRIPVRKVVVVAPRAQPQAPVVVHEPVAEPVPQDEGLVDAVDVRAAPRAQAVVAAGPASVGDGYVVQPGDSVWGIAKKMGVDQNELMKANGLSDPRKLRTGMKLKKP
ncbi:MAG TPA: LysM peptidoglycan-binding domain-containing protein [Luteolibacter sp.]|nr:LysM peptidoglycan-binding domain-containing protein [Luteolibacter sp.]